jgi:hypothetical protein
VPQEVKNRLVKEDEALGPDFPRRFTSEGPNVGFVDRQGKFITRQELERRFPEVNTRYNERRGGPGPSSENVDYLARAYQSDLRKFHAQDGWQREARLLWDSSVLRPHAANDSIDLFDDARTNDDELAKLLRETPKKPWFKPDIGAERQADLVSRLSEARGRMQAQSSQLARDLLLASTGSRGLSVRQAALAESLIGQAGPAIPTAAPTARAGLGPAEMREKYRGKRTGRFRAYLPQPGVQEKAERAEAAFRKVRGRWDVLTAGDDKVCARCQEISDNGPYTIRAARSLIPAHPEAVLGSRPIACFCSGRRADQQRPRRE